MKTGKSMKTCGNCEYLRLSSLMRGTMVTAFCGNTDDQLIVPHSWDGEIITLWRVPEFCTNPDAIISPQRAPEAEWVTVNPSDREVIKL